MCHRRPAVKPKNDGEDVRSARDVQVNIKLGHRSLARLAVPCALSQFSAIRPNLTHMFTPEKNLSMTAVTLS